MSERDVSGVSARRLWHEGRKILVGLGMFAALFVPILIGAWIGDRIGQAPGMLLGGILWPGILFLGFMAWALGDSFE